MDRRPRRVPALLLFLAFALASGCGDSKSGTPSAPSPPNPEPTPPPTGIAGALQVLSTKAIYFGHQSVGFNIMDGVQALLAAQSTPVPKIVSSSAAAAMQKGSFAHSSNGSNGDPAGKSAAFLATIDGGVGAKVDIAFFKFCYVDFGAHTDVPAVFADYRIKMSALKAAYPAVRLVHFTVPLTTNGSDNAVRERFNDLVRQAYSGSEPLFDLAKVESTRPDGTAEIVNGTRALVPGYSSDGGHLNATGADLVARGLVIYLAGL